MSNKKLIINSRYRRVDTLKEEFYNPCGPNGYADYLKNPHYHHSDKGCKIEMGVEYGNRKGEISMPGVVKRCITHNKFCSKTGWEKGWDSKGRTDINICVDCGKEINSKYTCFLCDDCKIKRRKKSLIKATNKHRKKIKDLELEKMERRRQKIAKIAELVKIITTN